MKHCTLPTLLAVKTTILPTVPRAVVPAKNGKNSETGKKCVFCAGLYLALFPFKRKIK